MNGSQIFPILSFLVLIFLISGRIIYLKQKGINVSPGSRKTSISRVFLYLMFLPILLIYIFEMAKPVFPFTYSILPCGFTNILAESFLLNISGVSVIILALIFLLISLLHFKTSLRFSLDENNRGKLITSGIFSISRNPFFLSLDLYFLGIALLLPNFFFIGFSVLAFIGIHFFILKEEKFMLKNYGEEYENYLKKVRKYF